MGDEIRFLGDLQRIEVKPDDVFVLTTPHPMEAEAVKRLQQTWDEKMGKRTLIVMDCSMRLEVFGKAALPAQEG